MDNENFTRAVRQHLDNNPDLHNRALEVSESLTRDAIEHGNVQTYVGRLRAEAKATKDLASELRRMVEQRRDEVVPDRSSLVRTLLANALDAVDWEELAEGWVDAAFDEYDRNGIEALTQV